MNTPTTDKPDYILVVDDEEDILELIRYNVEKKGLRVTCVDSGEKALKSIHQMTPDVVVLDLMLPGIGGLDVCRMLKSDPGTRSIPILMLTAKGDESDIVMGLELGADDYVTKPFSMSVLTARIQALLRRRVENHPIADEKISRGSLMIDPLRREVTVENIPIDLTFSEFQILHLLMRHPGLVFTRDQIIDAIRGDNYFVTERSVDFQFVGLRKKLGSAGKCIETVRGVGYRFHKETN